MKKVLWLASWYPSEMDAFTGDFIKRMAEATALYQPLNLIFVCKYDSNKKTGKAGASNLEHTSPNLTENILYYTDSPSSFAFISKMHSVFSYFRQHLKIIRRLRKDENLPDLVHVQVAMKAGMIALYLKWRYRIPYVLTEHWTGYYPGSKNSLFKKNWITRNLTRRILKNSDRFMPVSAALGEQIREHWIKIPFQPIPNVVDTRLFYPSGKRPANRFRFIHVSSMLPQKNPEGIIRSFVALVESGTPAELVLVGPLNPALENLIRQTDTGKKNIRCTGEISYAAVALELRQSNALVMFSNYENMPCTILEAMCTGLPVIATAVGGIPEIIGEENGLLVPVGDERKLTMAMRKLISDYDQYDGDQISRSAASRFSYEAIGKKINGIYEMVWEQKNQR